MTLTNGDFKNLKELISQTIEERTEDLLVTKEDVKHHPTKKEFFDREDKMMGELKVIREEITLLSDLNRKANDNEERIDKVEKKLNIQPAI
ncbi:hypothetical protein HY045_02745 [Candidatus Woesebacteria bacterium]|nr:hypothetical protein [Candidatus Woesebacteria bacterium]